MMKRYYINVEWDILRVPAERHVKVYPCCPEPYPGCLPCLFVADYVVLNQIQVAFADYSDADRVCMYNES